VGDNSFKLLTKCRPLRWRGSEPRETGRKYDKSVESQLRHLACFASETRTANISSEVEANASTVASVRGIAVQKVNIHLSRPQPGSSFLRGLCDRDPEIFLPRTSRNCTRYEVRHIGICEPLTSSSANPRCCQVVRMSIGYQETRRVGSAKERIVPLTP